MSIFDMELNVHNGADKITQAYAAKCLEEFDGHLYGAEMGVAYGGGIAKIGKSWGNRGTVYGFDTFEGHPIMAMTDRCKDTQDSGGTESFASRCMDFWYGHPQYGVEKFRDGVIQEELDKENLTNVKLIKGLVTDKLDISFIPELHYVFLDMDFPQAQWDGYNVVKHKIVKGGYLCLHDMVKPGHIHGCYERFLDIVNEDLFEIVEARPDPEILAVLKKK
jgi:hypothetical protein